MKKKRSVGIIVIGTLEVFIGLISVYHQFGAATLRFKIPDLFSLAGLLFYGQFFFLVFLVALGIYTLQLKPIARRLNLIFSLFIAFYFYSFIMNLLPKEKAQKIADIIIFWGINGITFRLILMGMQIVAIALIIIFFFTRPKVKEQFK